MSCRQRIAVTFFMLMIVCVSSGRVNGQEILSVYTDSLHSDWVNWSWGIGVDFNNTSPRVGNTGASIAVTHNSAWSGFYLHSNTPLITAGYETLRFEIHGGLTGGHAIRLVPYDGGGSEGSPAVLNPTAAGTWSSIELPVSVFGVSTIGGFVWQETSGGAQPVYYLDNIHLVAGDEPPPGDGPALMVDAGTPLHTISPLIYGMNFASEQLAADLNLSVRRMGGNAVTRYNWQNDTSNRGSDWFFENIPNNHPDPASLPDGSASDLFIEQNLATGTESIITVPLIGWTPKDRVIDCGFRVSLYGPQQEVDPWRPDCGNGIDTSGADITGTNPLDTSVAIDETFVEDWIEHLIGRYGNAASGGVAFYNLDNEPMLWNSTHRDVHPAGASYDELRDRTIQYAAAVKSADPTAETLGPVLWGWTAYFYSAADTEVGGDWWNTRPDRMAHGDVPFVPWYLQQMSDAEQSVGVRLLDYLDLHYYPQALGVALGGAGDAATQARRLRSTRSLWDPGYVDESWIGEPVTLIPRMRGWVETNYPGTKLAMTEYNWGGHEHISGALAQADVLGIFGREGLDLATLWGPPEFDDPAAFAFRIYRNYDGAGGSFGSTSLPATSEDQDEVSVYAARKADTDVTIVMINKTIERLTCPLRISGAATAQPAERYVYSAVEPGQIVREDDFDLTGPDLSIELPPRSITLFVLYGAGPLGDCDADGDVDLADFSVFETCLTGPDLAPGSNCECSDLDSDADVDLLDFGIMQASFTDL